MSTTETSQNPLKLWVEALKSKRYSQTTEKLRSTLANPSKRTDGFCCLGVACELYAETHPEAKWGEGILLGDQEQFLEKDSFYVPNPDWDPKIQAEYDADPEEFGDYEEPRLNEQEGELPYEVKKWLGVDDSAEADFIQLNDTEKATFEQIAAEVEKRYPKVFA